MKQPHPSPETWLDLSAAADYLGVHFTTLRRWADAGEIAHMRTPGGRRRFSMTSLQAFLQQSGHAANRKSEIIPVEERAVLYTRNNLRELSGTGGWLERMSTDQRLAMRGTGNRLMALLLQYNSHGEGGEAFLEEARRIARGYALICAQAGLSLPETTEVFLFFRRSVLDAIHQTSSLCSGEDPEGFRLYQRTNNFLDTMLLDLLGSYLQAE
jgi:excisionase family DNA binding protein